MPSNSIRISPPLFIVRGRQVILDSDLAALFGVPTRRLNEQIRRNLDRFPEDFAFLLNADESASLMSQNATSNKGRGGRRKLPFMLTEHGVVMAANVLNSPRAVAMSVEVVRAFIRLRKAAHSDRSLRKKVAQLESAVKSRLERHDADIEQLFKTVESLLNEDLGGNPGSVRRIGFVPWSP
jgi:phage regulator Rha-like protein